MKFIKLVNHSANIPRNTLASLTLYLNPTLRSISAAPPPSQPPPPLSRSPLPHPSCATVVLLPLWMENKRNSQSPYLLWRIPYTSLYILAHSKRDTDDRRRHSGFFDRGWFLRIVSAELPLALTNLFCSFTASVESWVLFCVCVDARAARATSVHLFSRSQSRAAGTWRRARAYQRPAS